ncbi:MAG: sulfatase-like hydrolase/transferase, partial [Planctomycetales bacterium]|nr:sulfatase-like hydrolase/transferase [Planctomycetales bacterium]
MSIGCRNWLTGICGVMAAMAWTPAGPAHAQKPNVVVIISDDQGYGDYGFMGHDVIQTPRLDQLASESLVYTR